MTDSTKKNKFLIFIPAYNVEKQIPRVLNKIPFHLLSEYDIRILIIEDCSSSLISNFSSNFKAVAPWMELKVLFSQLS